MLGAAPAFKIPKARASTLVLLAFVTLQAGAAPSMPTHIPFPKFKSLEDIARINHLRAEPRPDVELAGLRVGVFGSGFHGFVNNGTMLPITTDDQTLAFVPEGQPGLVDGRFARLVDCPPRLGPGRL